MKLVVIYKEVQKSKFKKQNYFLGISLLELVIVLAILITMVISGITSLSEFRTNVAVADSKEKIMLALSRARSKTLASELGNVYGVHFQTDKAVLFIGPIYIVSEPSNEEYVFDNRAQIYNISIADGSNVLFERLTGETSNTGTVILRAYNDKWLWSTTTIGASGLIE
ncbi:MAG TPA: hypothetical protein VJI73_02685 [Candidatus Paceibacterota bacterium]